MMNSNHLTWMSVMVALGLAGCAAHGNIELLESELRRQEDLLADAERRLSQTKSELHVARQEAAMLRDQLTEQGHGALLPEQADLLFRATGIRFHSFLTTGIDRDEQPGDELLSVLLVPHDNDGALLKLPGTIELRAVDLAQPDGEQELGAWSYTAEESRQLWHSGFFASGYLLEVPWQRVPSRPEVTLHARLTTLDGREFVTTQQVSVVPASSEASPGSASAEEPGAAASTSLKPVSGEMPAPQPVELDPPGRAPVNTSDRWTEAEIPTIR